jgi:hypothetical protein
LTSAYLKLSWMRKGMRMKLTRAHASAVCERGSQNRPPNRPYSMVTASRFARIGVISGRTNFGMSSSSPSSLMTSHTSSSAEKR